MKQCGIVLMLNEEILSKDNKILGMLYLVLLWLKLNQKLLYRLKCNKKWKKKDIYDNFVSLTINHLPIFMFGIF
jgi:hypothetical protein